MLPEEYQIHLDGANTVYESMQIVCDFVSGLTDSSALKLHQTISGVRIS
jgi:dGTP triphosphohydrolase